MSYQTMKPGVNAAFKVLRKAGFTAKQNFMCCQSCACAELPDKVEKYVYYHQQDNDSFKEGHGLMLAWGSGLDLNEKELRKLGREIRDAFIAQGFKIEWNGTSQKRILVKES